SIADATRQVGITESRYYRWREERGALKRDELKKPKELAHEGPKGLAQGEVSAVRDNAQREFKAEPAGFEEYWLVATWAGCARAASGHAAAPPSSVMNSRRFIRSPRRRGPLAVAARSGRASWRS